MQNPVDKYFMGNSPSKTEKLILLLRTYPIKGQMIKAVKTRCEHERKTPTF